MKNKMRYVEELYKWQKPNHVVGNPEGKTIKWMGRNIWRNNKNKFLRINVEITDSECPQNTKENNKTA